jgi:hypothetical protein
VVCEIIAATAAARWTAIKVTPHDHEASSYGDTERYLAAGAERALLVNHLGEAKYEGNVIVESNTVMDTLTPDLFVFVDGGAEWKPSAIRHADKAHYMVRGHATSELIAHITLGVNREQA